MIMKKEKKRKDGPGTLDESGAKFPSLSRTPSSLGDLKAQIRELPKGAVVHLKPRVVLDAKAISRIEVSGRTPSPFGSRMGDHTVAWQVLVDALCASLYDLPLTEAINKLDALQKYASQWMPDEKSQMRRLLRLVDKPRALADRLEDAAGRFDECLKAARSGIDEPAICQHLGQAIAYHLAYLNYLPFATVPAASQRGSPGGTEGHFRRTLLAFESGGPSAKPELEMEDLAGEKMNEKSDEEDEIDLIDRRRRQLTEALWGMFAFDAAIRESDIELAIDDSSLRKAEQQVAALGKLKTALVNLAKDSKNLSDTVDWVEEQ